ncbi:hypothetical protein JTB14_010387 [Gonioctena quinquepunctata]|nr:hypothetical protein JTB14_010387 [Gonioctena quinquepunctata]
MYVGGSNPVLIGGQFRGRKRSFSVTHSEPKKTSLKCDYPISAVSEHSVVCENIRLKHLDVLPEGETSTLGDCQQSPRILSRLRIRLCLFCRICGRLLSCPPAYGAGDIQLRLIP